MAPEVGDLQQALRHVLLPESACESQTGHFFFMFESYREPLTRGGGG
jgi:hypothetical protein